MEMEGKGGKCVHEGLSGKVCKKDSAWSVTWRADVWLVCSRHLVTILTDLKMSGELPAQVEYIGFDD